MPTQVRHVVRIWSMLLAAFVLLQASSSFADSASKLVEGKKSSIYTRPGVETGLKFVVGDEQRPIPIFRSDETSNWPHLYFHTPTWRFIPRETPLPGYPAQVRHVEHTNTTDAEYILTFLVELTSSEVQQKAEAVIRDNPRELEHLSSNGITAEEVDVWGWPLTRLHLDVTSRYRTTTIFATTSTRSLINVGESLEIAVPFSESNLEEFLAAVENNEVVFSYFYSFQGTEVFNAQVDITGKRSIRHIIESALEQEQVEGGGPIFHGDRNRVGSEISNELTVTMRVQHPKLLAIFDINRILGQVFEGPKTLTIEEARADHPDFDRALAGYMKPHVKRARERNSRSDTDRQSSETQTTSTTERNFETDAGLNLKYEDIGLSIGTSAENKSKEVENAKKQLWRETKVGYESDTDLTTFMPHRVGIYQLREGWQDVTVDLSLATYFSTGAEDFYREDTPVPLSYTTTHSAVSFSPDDDRFEAVPVGTILPYFGETLPTSGKWAWCDGKSNFPEDWEPARLGGKPVPDMRGKTLFGVAEGVTSKHKRLGKEVTASDEVQHSIPQKKLTDGSGFSLKVTKLQEARNNVDEHDGGTELSIQQVKSTAKVTGSITLPSTTVDFTREELNPSRVYCYFIIRLG